MEHALVRLKFYELGSIYLGNFYLSWRAIEALDAAETGDAEEAELLRVLTPMTKKSTAETSVYAVREAMELMGGMGYIEDGAMPKIMRDMMVLPIWEGAGNIMILDMLRASSKSKGLDILFKELETAFEEISERDVENKEQWQKILIQIKEIKSAFHNITFCQGNLFEIA